MNEQQIDNNLLADISKITAEIEELNATKTALVRDINISILETKKQADMIIGEAKGTAQVLIKEATKLKEDALVYVETKKKEIDNLLYLNESKRQELKEIAEKQEKFRNDFEAAKNAHEVKVITDNDDLHKISERLKEKQEESDNLWAALRAKNVEITDRETKLMNDLLEFEGKLKKFEADRKVLDANIELYNKDKTMIDAQKADNEKMLAEILVKQNEIKEDTILNKKLLEEIDTENKKIIKQKKIINTQFELIDKNQKELEEKDIALKEREQLIAIKDKDITDKVKILQELRMRKGEK